MIVYSNDCWQKELAFKRAYELAIAQETAEKNTAELKQKEAMSTPGNPKGVSVHQLQKQRVLKAGNYTNRLTRYPVVVITVVHRDTYSSSAGSRMSNVLAAAKLGMQRLFVAQ